MMGHEAPWVDSIRRDFDDLLLRAYECIAASGTGLGGPELASAERSARALIRLAPYRESAHRLLMQVLASQGNVAEALLTFENLRCRLRDELGTNPAPDTQALHAQLLKHGRALLNGSDPSAARWQS
jgi:DNA-binding SARP family transcriptional activator